MKKLPSVFLNQKIIRPSSRPSNSSDINPDEEFIDINNIKIPSTPFIPYSNFNFNFNSQNSPQNNKDNSKQKQTLYPYPLITTENLIYSYISPKFDSLCLDEISLNSLMKIFPKKRLNVVLDIDQTLIYSKDLVKFNDVTRNLITDDTHKIKVNVQSKDYDFALNLRNHLKSFLQSISKFSTVYICTLSHENYAKQIIDILRKISNIEIKDDNIIAVGANSNYETFPKSISLFKNITNSKNTVILDDTASVWVDSDLPNLILSKKYFSFKDIDIIPFQYLGANNTRIERDCYFEDEQNTVPIYVENEFSSKMQLKYIASFIEKAFKLSIIRNEEMLDSMRKLKKRILMKCNINLNYFTYTKELNFVKDLIKYLGGNDNIEKSTTTHFIVSSKFKRLAQQTNGIMYNNNGKESANKSVYYVNLKWLFHCYFYLEKMDELSDEYKM